MASAGALARCAILGSEGVATTTASATSLPCWSRTRILSSPACPGRAAARARASNIAMLLIILKIIVAGDFGHRFIVVVAASRARVQTCERQSEETVRRRGEMDP